MAQSAAHLSTASQSLAQGACEQAASVEQTSASTEQIRATISASADKARQSGEAMIASDHRNAEAQRALIQMETTVAAINSSSDKISKILKVIDEIAFQTNILALNATVEAARAGEAGLGFAVVADEVGKLAQRSAQAARDTAALIEESSAKSREGKTGVELVGAAIRNITQESAKVRILMDEIRLGSEEQAKGIEQIARAVAEIEKVTQSNASNAEETAASSEQMSSQAEMLQVVSARLGEMIGGAR